MLECLKLIMIFNNIKVLIHWLTNRTTAKMSEKTFYNDVEVMAGDVYQQIGLLHTTVCIHIQHIYVSILYFSREIK